MEKEKTEESKKHFEGTQLTDDELAAVTGGVRDAGFECVKGTKEECLASFRGGKVRCEWGESWLPGKGPSCS